MSAIRVEVVKIGGFKPITKFGRGTPVRFVVQVKIYEQEMWETLTHACQFEEKADAETLCRNVLAAVRVSQKSGEFASGKFFGLNLANWTWEPSRSCPFSALQNSPTAQPYDYTWYVNTVRDAIADAAEYVRIDRGPGSR